jgi:hypothetical protein
VNGFRKCLFREEFGRSTKGGRGVGNSVKKKDQSVYVAFGLNSALLVERVLSAATARIKWVRAWLFIPLLEESSRRLGLAVFRKSMFISILDLLRRNTPYIGRIVSSTTGSILAQFWASLSSSSLVDAQNSLQPKYELRWGLIESRNVET